MAMKEQSIYVYIQYKSEEYTKIGRKCKNQFSIKTRENHKCWHWSTLQVYTVQ